MRLTDPTYSGRLAAELARVLLSYPDDQFSPSELVEALRNSATWAAYLSDFETDRGQPAAVGRFLNELGVSRSVHHRSRGSLYSSQAALLRLRQVIEELAAQEPEMTGELPHLEVREGVVVMESPPDDRAPAAPATIEAPRRRAGDRSEAATGAGTGMGAGAGGAAGAGAAPARAVPVIGWRRRTTDLARPRVQPAAASSSEVIPPPAEPAGYAAAGGGGAPPVWVGGGGALPAATYPAPLAYPGMPDFTAPATGPEEVGLPLAFYWTQIRRHLYKIILAAVAITGLATFYSLRIPKLYEAAVTLRMDFGTPAMIADAQANPAFDPATLIRTEIQDITQRGVILDAITKAHLDRDPNLRRQLGVSSTAAPTTADPDALNDALVDLISAHTTAISPESTHNIEIHYRSLNPDTSATVANALGNALIAHDFQTRQQEQDDSLHFMTQQFEDVKARLEREQAALTEYQHANNILNPDGQSSIENATLSSLNNSFLAAQSELTKYEAEEKILATRQPTDALLASDDGQVLRPSYDAWRAAQMKFGQVKATRGPANPEYAAAANSLATARQQLDLAMASVKNQIDSQYKRAQAQLALVKAQLDQARRSAQSFNDKEIDYRARKHDFDADQRLYDNLLSQIKQQQLTASLSGSNLRITNQATPDPEPVYPDVKRNVMLALMFSLFCGCGLAVLAGYMDRSFTSPDGVEQYLRIPLLGALPQMEEQEHLMELAQPAPNKSGARSAFAESILMLRTAVLYAAPRGFRSLSITSAQPQEGKSVILANLAVALALHGSKVLLIDADIRRPTQHRLFETPNHAGLSNVLRQTAPLEACFRATTVERLYLMPAGPAVPNPSELVATMLGQALAPLAAEFDFVLVDSPPLLGFADAVSIATMVEGTLLVAQAGKTPRELVHAALQPLKRVRARVLGLVLNQVSSSLSPYYSYYRNHYAQYYREPEEPEASS